jgi:YidC/Oxa1 family membrane protein insertase
MYEFFSDVIIQPIFNLLVLIYALLPGHNFGLALILFTIVIRLLLWPLIKKQLHQVKVMRKIQPELRKIKKEAKGDRQKEAMLTMALYKEYGVNPFGSIGVMLLQLPILIGLYAGLNRLIKDEGQIISYAYPFLQDLGWMKHLAENIHAFDMTLFGIVDLSKAALSGGSVYWPAMIIVAASAVIQFYTSKQLIPTDKEARKLRDILKQAGEGKQADQSEVNAAVSRSTIYMLPGMVFIFTVNIASALSLYWLAGGLVAFIQQSIILREDKDELMAPSNKKISDKKAAAIDAEIVSEPTPKKSSSSKSKKGNSKRRKK